MINPFSKIKHFSKKARYAAILVFVSLCLGGFGIYNLLRVSNSSFDAPGTGWKSARKVEDYFIGTLRMSPQEAYAIRAKSDGTVDLRTNDKTTLEALTGNLYYYGFVRDEASFREALEKTQDTTPSQNAILVGDNGTIDRNAEYRISENMSAWEIADVLLNKPSGHFDFDEYGYFFMP